MKCPKCQYLGFDGQTRCRHCGYDLSLAATADVPGPDEGEATGRLRAEPSAREQARAAIQKRAGTRTPTPEFDLPLFATPGADDRPVAAAPPRPPLAVRRPTTEGPRARAAAATALSPAVPASAPAEDTSARLDLPLDSPGDALAEPEPIAMRLDADVADPVAPESVDAPAAPAAGPATIAEPLQPDPAAETTDAEDAGSILAARAAAGLIDIGLLLALDAAVYLGTLRVTGLSLAEASRLPLAPMLVFFVLLAMGYLSMCTLLAGQTFGKRLFHLKVVEVGGRPVRFGHAVVRAGLQVLTVPLLGLGFLPALLGTDRRSLYDRLAGTEVVRLHPLQD